MLKQITRQEWVLERILQCSEEVQKNNAIVDPMFSPKQAQRLLQLICFSEQVVAELAGSDQSAIIQKFFEMLDRWNLRIIILNLSMMHKQASTTVSETNKYLDAVARCVVESYYTQKQKRPK